MEQSLFYHVSENSMMVVRETLQYPMERESPLRQKHRRSLHSSGFGVQNENRRLSTSPQDSSLLYSSHSSNHRRGDSGRDDSPLSSMVVVSLI